MVQLVEVNRNFSSMVFGARVLPFRLGDLLVAESTNESLDLMMEIRNFGRPKVLFWTAWVIEEKLSEPLTDPSLLAMSRRLGKLDALFSMLSFVSLQNVVLSLGVAVSLRALEPG
jgi:hypothetical protein